MEYRSCITLLATVGIAGCGNVGSSDETVSLADAGLNVSVTVPAGGKVEASRIGPAVMWKGLRFHASLYFAPPLAGAKAEPLALGEHGTYEARTPVVVDGKRYTCMVSAKEEADAQRIQKACETLSAASPSPASGDASNRANPAPAAIELEMKEVPAIGCSILLPKGAKTLSESEYAATYSLVFPGGIHELNVSVNSDGTSSLDEAKRNATLMGGSIASARQLPNGLFEVVLEARGPIQTVSTFGRKFGAKCSGPTEYLAKLSEMCESLSALAPAKATDASRRK